MTEYLIRRVLVALLIVALMMTIVFFGINVIGDPVYLLVDPSATQVQIEEARRSLGLDQPIIVQYFHFVSSVMQGDFGRSFVFNRPAMDVILERLPATLELAGMAFIISLVLGIPLGLLAGLYPHSKMSKAIMAGSVLGFSLPSFWVGILFIMIFSVNLGWLPATGRGDTVDVFGIQLSFLTWDGLRHLMLPALNLALFKISVIIRLVRAGTVEVISQDFVKFARAKGVTGQRLVWKHIAKNVMVPVVTVIGMELGQLIAFSVVTETIFSWPGTGRLIIESILQLDRPVVVAYLMMITVLFVLINLIVDVLYTWLDPRIRIGAVAK
ncbi:ABC transporter permease [Bacillus subtilis]|uniref:ABC transporter permease n=1 Tax=Pseudochrobactrum asaccharolyticum TaxID=354351 RepID=UPI001F303338|nr:ABC transporter permease [Pseudochrobactrum asaccharolyticum]MCF7647209.1 ABC transporter permease [Pseudochrobactrum asaccharolyticum]MCF7673475.1 ABC transporter permease [Bacillus subtilis]